VSVRPSVRLGADLYWSGSEAAFHAVAASLRGRLTAAREELRAETEAAGSFGWLAPADLPEPGRTELLRALAEADAAPEQDPSTAAELGLLGRMARQALRDAEAQ
jgi:hypothetical protein